MCRTYHFHSRNCGHHWLQIATPCFPGWGFNTCRQFGDGVARDPSEFFNVDGLCPSCGYPGTYERNQIRMVYDIKNTSHVAYERIYEPAEDSFLLLDTLSSPSETAFLQARFRNAAPLVVEIGPGSGVVIGFVNAHAGTILGSGDVLTTAIDVNNYACKATGETVRKAAAAAAASNDNDVATTTSGRYLGGMQGDLVAPLRDASVDVLIFNPPYVPTSELPREPTATDMVTSVEEPTFQDDSYLLSLSYAGGVDGMEITNPLLEDLPRVLTRRGCAYILLCAQNKPDEVKQRIRNWGPEWRVETVGSSGKTAGWEKLQIIRIWRAE